MTFNLEYFQKHFRLIMGTNVASILANIYLAKLEKILLEKCKTNKKLVWTILFRRFIDDGLIFGITKGSRLEFEYWYQSLINYKIPLQSIHFLMVIVLNL